MKLSKLLAIMIISSFILGLCADLSVNIIKREMDIFVIFFRSGDFQIVSIVLLISHLGVCALYPLRKIKPRYFYLLLFFIPFSFLISYIIVIFVAFYFYPIIILSFSPFIVPWIIALNKVYKEVPYNSEPSVR